MNASSNLQLLVFILLFPIGLIAQMQNESSAPVEYFNTVSPEVEAWENYFDERYFSQGVDPLGLGEGTGYLPYLRQRHLYDMRRDFTGRTGAVQRWELFKSIRAKALNRGGDTPVADWQSIGPNKMEGFGGRMISHAFDPNDSQIIYAGSATGGLWKTENGGDLWLPLTDQIPSTGVGAVVVNPNNPEEILIGTGEGYVANGFDIRPGLGVFKSINGGLSWEQSDFAYIYANDVSVFKLIWHPSNENIVWMGATNGIWKSTDGGLSWQQTFGDGTNQATSICDDMVLHPTDPDILYAGIEGDGIWKSIDAGESWFKLENGLPAGDLDFISIDICISQPDVLLTSMTSSASTGFSMKGLFRSLDGGETWTEITEAPNAFCVPPALGTACQGFYNNIVAVSPDDPDHIWLGGITLWRSTDGGETWVQRDRYTCIYCNEPPACRTYVDQHDFAFDPADPETMYVFNDGGIAKSTDGGDCWEQKNEGLVTAHFYGIAASSANPDIVIGGFQDHGLQGVDISEGDEWDRWGWFDGNDVEVHPDNTNILFGTWINGLYLKTTGGVHTLSFQITTGMNLNENSGAHFAPLRISPADPDVLLGCTEARIYRSTNGGSSWQAVADAPNVTEVAFSQADPQHCYAAAWVGNDWRFYHSSDGGANWDQTANPPGWRITDLKTSFSEPGTVYATRNSINPNTAHVYRSTDFGESWLGIQGDLPDIPVNGFAINPFWEENLYVATDLGVFTTTDGGATWTEFNDNLPISISMDIMFNTADTSIVIGTLGRGAWRSKACMPDLTGSVEAEIPDRFGISGIFPNPANGPVQIEYYLNEPAPVQISILDQYGQQIKLLLSEHRSAGEHQLSWDGLMENGVPAPSGIYFVRLKAGRKMLVKKLVISSR